MTFETNQAIYTHEGGNPSLGDDGGWIELDIYGFRSMFGRQVVFLGVNHLC